MAYNYHSTKHIAQQGPKKSRPDFQSIAFISKVKDIYNQISPFLHPVLSLIDPLVSRVTSLYDYFTADEEDLLPESGYSFKESASNYWQDQSADADLDPLVIQKKIADHMNTLTEAELSHLSKAKQELEKMADELKSRQEKVNHINDTNKLMFLEKSIQFIKDLLSLRNIETIPVIV
ncbi:MAG TPA: hypothetical protein DF296_06950 [Candidatus Margulisbacteria bacterium]|nr:hypothetical protein [Candidatus Margulisiibacteriota bacterium]